MIHANIASRHAFQPYNLMVRNSATTFAVAAIAVLFAGCTPALVGTAGIAGSGAFAGDRRTAGTILEDETIEWKVRTALHAAGLSGDRHHISATSFNRIVLLTGQVPDENAKQLALREAGRVAEVREAYDEIQVGSPTSLARRSEDTLVTGRVKFAMTVSAEVTAPANLNVKVVTENGVVFLMGLVTRAESERITTTVRGVPGVAHIVRLFEYLEAEPTN